MSFLLNSDAFISHFISQHQLDAGFLATANQYYLPLAKHLVKLRQLKRNNSVVGSQSPLFVGINGCQGSGKSTLVTFLQSYLQAHDSFSVAVLSLDDFYLAKKQRAKLAKTIHPLFQTRGVPGTHNIKLLRQTLNALAGFSNSSDQRVMLPRFNKVTDEPFEPVLWPGIDSVDIVLFEGWCWGVPAQPDEELTSAVNKLEECHDEHGIWRRAVNNFLMDDYQTLFQYMDYWLTLQAPDFACVYQWRLEQEQKLIKQSIQDNAKQGEKDPINCLMTAEQISQFILYFQRLTQYSFNRMPDISDKVFYLNKQRVIVAEEG